MKNSKAFSLKDGTIITSGTDCALTFNHERPSLVTILPTGYRQFNTATAKLPRFFASIEAPSMEELEEANSDGVCPSVLGDRVEPDGWDSEGSPSWMLALGYI